MGSVVIVAIPEASDKVHKLSSEKIPHLTMLYLGDVASSMDVPEIVTFVEHAAQHLNPFYLTVDYRGTLGEEDADVLFFENNMWELPKLKQFRHQLLLNNTIRKAYDSTEQFPEWQPHLTMGYPSAPAKEDDGDYPGIHSVRFDRLAVWFGDFEGPEIRLKYEETAMEVAMSTMEAGAEGAGGILAHYGKKGMRWGVRTNPDGTTSVDQTRVRKSMLNAKPVTVSQRRAGSYVTSKGGQRQVAADDAVKAQAGRQKAKKSTTDALTNKELKATIERMNLEQQFHTLVKKTNRQTRGQRFIQALMRNDGAKKVVVKAAKTRRDGSVVQGKVVSST